MHVKVLELYCNSDTPKDVGSLYVPIIHARNVSDDYEAEWRLQRPRFADLGSVRQGRMLRNSQISATILQIVLGIPFTMEEPHFHDSFPMDTSTCEESWLVEPSYRKS